MRVAAVVGLVLALGACQPDLSQDVSELRSELARQQAEIDRLSTFVDAQANVLAVCEGTPPPLAETLDHLCLERELSAADPDPHVIVPELIVPPFPETASGGQST